MFDWEGLGFCLVPLAPSAILHQYAPCIYRRLMAYLSKSTGYGLSGVTHSLAKVDLPE